MVDQWTATRSRLRVKPLGGRAPLIPADVGFERVEDRSKFDLVRRAEEILDPGTLQDPGWYISDEANLECFQLKTKDGFRVALIRSSLESGTDPLLVLVGSINNFIGAAPNDVPSPTGFFPSFAEGLAPMIQRFNVRPRKRPIPLPADDDEEAIQQLVHQAADFAFEFDGSMDDDLRIVSGNYSFGAQIWYVGTGVTVGSLRKGFRRTFAQVLVGTPPWIRSAKAQPLREGDSS